MAQEYIRLHLFNQDHDIPVEESLDPATSLHTGRTLRHARIAFDLEASKSEEMNALLSAARDPDHALAGEEGISWAVLSSSYSYREGDATYNFQVEVQEVEQPPQAERVEMLDVSLVPLKYKEETFDDGALLISLLVSLDDEEDSILAAAIENSRTAEKYFNAVRVGVSGQSLSVRFGRCLWKREEGRPPLRLLRLVADANLADRDNDSFFLRIHQPELSCAQEKIAALEDVVSALIKRLVEADVLDEDAAQAIRAETDGSWDRHVNDFDEAIDIESYF